MTPEQLRSALESHGMALRALGADVRELIVEPPATPAELDAVEAELGFALPQSLRDGLGSLARAVEWSWFLDEEMFDELPVELSDIYGGELRWSLANIRARHADYLMWVKECFPDPQDPYDAPWHGKMGFSDVGNGDVVAVDLDPSRAGWITYLSHDAGEGHGYVMAHSLQDLVERWAPLACPGPEDWHWLPFVPFDFGPIDPASDNAIAWRSFAGLTAAPPTTEPRGPDDALFDALLREYEEAGGSPRWRETCLRALRVCSTERADDVIRLLDSDDEFVQAEAAKLLGNWRWTPATPDLLRVALGGKHNGRLSAIGALRSMPGADSAREEVRSQLGPGRAHLLPE